MQSIINNALLPQNLCLALVLCYVSTTYNRENFELLCHTRFYAIWIVNTKK